MRFERDEIILQKNLYFRGKKIEIFPRKSKEKERNVMRGIVCNEELRRRVLSFFYVDRKDIIQ